MWLAESLRSPLLEPPQSDAVFCQVNCCCPPSFRFCSSSSQGDGHFWNNVGPGSYLRTAGKRFHRVRPSRSKVLPTWEPPPRSYKRSLRRLTRAPTLNVEVTSSDDAITALLNGEVDLASIGRPLTEAEAAQGLITVPLEREKNCHHCWPR